MAITTLDQLIAAARQTIRLWKLSGTVVANSPYTLLDLGGNPGAGSLAIGNTTSGVVPTDATAGFPTINTFGGGNTGYLQSVSFNNNVGCFLCLFDRLFHAGSFNANALATTTLTSQPSFASRIPNGDYSGLELFVEINQAISNTATTVAIGYTNDAGTPGRTTGALSIQNLPTRRLVQMPLQAGDKGVQSIDSVTVGGTVATAGTFNVVLARCLWANRIAAVNFGGYDGPDVIGLPEIYDTSALWPVIYADGTASGTLSLMMDIANG